MSSSAINQSVFQAKVSGIQNQADSTSIYSNGVWSFKNSTALTSVTITDSGNVGIGTSSPVSKLNPMHTFAAGYIAAEYPITITASQPGAYFSQAGIQFRWNDTGNNAAWNLAGITGVVDGWTAPNASGALVFSTKGFGPYSGALTERMRIDASGNLLVGTTSSSDNTDGVKIEQTALRNIKIMKTSTGAVNGLLFYQAGIYQGGLNYGNGSTSLATSSDERLKKNIKTAENVLNKVQQIQVRSFDWKDYDAKVEYGFVAQELHQVFPEAVNVGKDNEEGGIEMPWSVSSSTLIPHLVKAIQELSAKNEALEARLAALESKP